MCLPLFYLRLSASMCLPLYLRLSASMCLPLFTQGSQHQCACPRDVSLLRCCRLNSNSPSPTQQLPHGCTHISYHWHKLPSIPRLLLTTFSLLINCLSGITLHGLVFVFFFVFLLSILPRVQLRLSVMLIFKFAFFSPIAMFAREESMAHRLRAVSITRR